MVKLFVVAAVELDFLNFRVGQPLLLGKQIHVSHYVQLCKPWQTTVSTATLCTQE